MSGYGAKEGLEQKMKYWHEKDYQYELGVTLGQAFNLAFKSGERDRAFVIEVFKRLLEAKRDPEVLELFDNYWNGKRSVGVRSRETSAGRELPVVRVD